MSRCISSHGEYSEHELVGNRCDWCRVWQCPVCGQDEPYPLDGDDHDCISDAEAGTVIAAYRESAICPECVFPEEAEPNGRLILAPCLTCGFSALDALAQRDAELTLAHTTGDQMAREIVQSWKLLGLDEPDADDHLPTALDRLLRAVRARIAEPDVPLNVAADLDQLLTEARFITEEQAGQSQGSST